jgi:uncharacterized protein (DUF2141 family)
MRRSVWVALGLMATCGVASAQQQDAPRYSAPGPVGQPLCTLRIHVTGFRNNKGDAGGTVFRSPDGWPEQNSKSVVHGPFPIANQQATEEFHLPAGKYAVAVIHDENMNHKLDRNFLGIPKEGFGFANNPKVALSAPSYEAAATQVSCPLTELEIHLIYKN